MMGVYIKGFPLPNNCGACPLRLAWCRERIYMVNRPERCPLVPVPPHGRLIDADAKVQTQLYDDEHEEWTDVEMTVEEDLGYCNNEVPTIIETEPKQKKYSTSEWCSECQRQKCFECCTAILKDGEVDEPTGFQRIQHIEDAPTIIEEEGTE